MDEPRTPPPAPSVATPRLDRRDLLLIVLLAVLTLGLRGIQLATTEVTARDSIGYIHIAWRLEHYNWRQVIPDIPQHPGYPFAVLAASLPARLLFPNDLPYAMQLAAQLASAAASILLVAPLYWLGVQLFNRRIAFGAVLLFQCLPCSGRILADGLSEGVFLLFAVTALATALHSLRTGSLLGFAVTGAASGLAYLTRPEGLIIPAAAGLTLLAMQAFARWRRPWLRVLAFGVVMTAAVLTIGGPFMILIGGLTNKNSANAMMKDAAAEATPPAQDGVADGPILAVWWQGDVNGASGRYLWGLTTLAEVLSKAFFFVLWIPALIGLICFHRRIRTDPGAWMVLLVCAVLGCLLYRVAVRMGYLSDRHTILILACGLLWTAAAVDGAGQVLARFLASGRPALAAKWWADGRAWAVCLLLVAACAPLVRTLEPLHGDRVGFRAAGYWLRDHARPDETIFDPFGWAGYYAGRYFRPEADHYFREEDFPAGPWNYVVLEEGANKHSHLVTVTMAENLAHSAGREIHQFAAPRGKETAKIVIYEVQNAGQALGEVVGRADDQ